MNPASSTVDASAVLAAARRLRREANAAEAGVLVQAVEWCRIHRVEEPDLAATWLDSRGYDTGIPIAGPGAPLVSEFAVAEFAAALGISAASGRNLVGQALELRHRLPKTWARVQDGSLASWRARRIAEQTITISLEAAAWVDAQVAPFAHTTGPAQVQRTVESAIARFMPDHAAEQRDRAAEQRYFTIDADQVSFAGTARVHGELDLVDALDLEDAVRAGAAQLVQLGCPDPLDVRRAAAVGMLARGEQALAFEGDETPMSRVRSREIVLYVHLSEDTLRSGAADAPVWLEDAGGRLLTAGQIAEWCGRPDTNTVTVKPVIDLHQTRAVDGYQVPEPIAEHVRLRDRTCIFPWCNRPARSCDLDHIDPYVNMADGGAPGQTSTENLAPQCRLHHRMKTHAAWTYTTVEPGVFLWHSPHGHTWLRDASGTTDLTRLPVDPPGDPPERRTS
ncbi:HNH endonuclease signature motif containing protein [Nocardioides terrisoli]|uniref:HNH endonuclease signature motif containing protein n=1 Tax=Nocardioides terrisoli TaxID=3388267 RepID=UPI00287B675C|nr:DUF222 domain-containing protein [Nocardioides marmorisolisilvae]